MIARPSNKLSPRSAWLGLVLVTTAAAGCSDFSDPVLGVCGNRIVEPGEACDDPDDAQCGGGSALNACRVLCTAPATVAPDDVPVTCPAAQQCGSDGVCRQPSEAFDDPLTLEEDGLQRIVALDMDHDGRDELVVQFADGDPDGVDVKYVFVDISEGTFGFEEVSLHEPLAAEYAVGDVDLDGRDDVLAFSEVSPGPTDATESTVSLFVGNLERQRRPSYFSTIPTTGDDARLIAPTPERDRVLELTADSNVRVWSSLEANATAAPPLGLSSDALGRSIPVGPIVDNGSCSGAAGDFDRPEVVLAEEGASAAGIYSTCADGEGLELVGEVTLPAGSTLGDEGTFLVDANSDGSMDIVAQADDRAVLIAYGVGDGSFHSDAEVPDEAGDGLFSTLLGAAVNLDLVLAVADFDADGTIELVTRTRYVPSPESCTDTCSDVFAWPHVLQHAVGLDINGDQRIDVAGIASDCLVIALSGALGPEPFETQLIELPGPGGKLVVGDFNRDTVADLAFPEHCEELPAPADERLTIFHGGSPETWRFERFGPFVDIEDITVEAGATIVARTRDAEGRAAGAFVRPHEDPHRFGIVLRAPAIVRTPSGRGAAALLVDPARGETSLGQLRFDVGSLSPHDLVVGDPLTGADDGFHVQMVAVDVDGDDVDELLGLGPGEVGNAWLARARTSGAWEIERSYDVGPGFARRPAEGEHTSAAFGPGGGRGSEVTRADVDEDGDLDILVTTDEAAPRLVLFRNDAGGLDPIKMDVHFAGEPFEIRIVAAWHGDGAGSMRFLVGGESGAGLGTIASGGDSMEVTRITSQPIITMAAADVDGDGLRDLVLANEDEVSILRARETVQ